jgi:hypothetical protein
LLPHLRSNSRRRPPRQSPRDAFPGLRGSGPRSGRKTASLTASRAVHPAMIPLATVMAILIPIFAAEIVWLADG